MLGVLVSGPLSSAGAQSSGGSGGVLRIPYDLTSFGGARWDPTTPSNPDIWYVQRWIYDTLMRQNADGSYSPGLAKSATATDPQTIVVELQARHQVLRRHAARRRRSEVQHRAHHRGRRTSVQCGPSCNEVESITVDSPTKLTIKLKTPIAGQFYNLLSQR